MFAKNILDVEEEEGTFVEFNILSSRRMSRSSASEQKLLIHEGNKYFLGKEVRLVSQLDCSSLEVK